jgi:hypothetical protein
MDKMNLAHISHDLRARDALHGERVRKHLFHCEHENMNLSNYSGIILKV